MEPFRQVLRPQLLRHTGMRIRRDDDELVPWGVHISLSRAFWAGRTWFSVRTVTEFCHHYATFWEAIADRFPDRSALQHGQRRVSWAGFERRSARLAGALQAWGLRHGDA